MRILIELVITFLTAYIISRFSQIQIIPWAAVVYSVIQVFNLLNAIGKKLPFKELILSVMAIQLLLTPFLEYHYFKLGVIGGMSVDDLTFFSYALPCNILIQIGIEIFYPRKNLENNLLEVLKFRVRSVEAQGFILIVIGYIGYFLGRLGFIFDSIDFIIYLLSFCRLIGFLYLWFSGSKHSLAAFILVIIPFVIESVNSTILIELIVYSMILMTAFFMKYRSSKLVIYATFIIAFILLLAVQSVKYDYREEVSKHQFTGNRFVLLTKYVFNQIQNYNDLDFKKLSSGINVRLNQGWIVSDVMNNLKDRHEKIESHYFLREVKGILLPRFLYASKPKSADHEKFYDFTGKRLSKKVAMTVGVMGDGYGNFGRKGGMVYCFGFGLFMGLMLRWWYKLSWKYPTLILWGVLIFFYSMRAGDETYTIINWLVKSAFVVFVYFFFFERHLTRSYFVSHALKSKLK